MKRNTECFPEDMLVEILSRVPEASLARLRSTSKGWNTLIKKEERLAKNLVVMLIDHKVYLVRLDLHDDNIVKVISQFSLNGPLPSSSKEVDIRRVRHCDGLLLCTTMDERLVVWNPCSGETSRIIKPLNSTYSSDTYALGKSSCNNEYKILRVHHRGHGFGWPCLVKYEIYDFISNSWRVVGETTGWTLPGFHRYGTSVDGNTYWLSCDFNQDCPNIVNSLRCFDFSTERFGCVSLPVDHASYNLFALSVTREEQKLCLLASKIETYDIIEIWMATTIKSNGDMSWSNLLTVKQTHPLCAGMSFLADREKKVLVCPTKDEKSRTCLHFVGTAKNTRVDHHDVGSESSLPGRLLIASQAHELAKLSDESRATKPTTLVYLARLDLYDNNTVKVISQLSLTDPLSSSSEEVDVRRVFHCDGLLLCTTMDERLVVWNPCSGENSRIIKPLNSKHSSDTYALGKSSCNNEYKILRVHHGGDGFCAPCLVKYEIYDFTSNSWRVVGEDRGWTFPGLWRHGGTSVDGNTYWLSIDFNQDRHQRGRDTLRCFDFSTEKFGLVSLPGDPISCYPFALSVTSKEQNLCLLTSCPNLLRIDVWMATKIKGTGDMSWSKLLSVKRTSSYQFFTLCKGMSFLADRENKVILHPIKYKDSSQFLHIVGEDKYKKVDLHDVGSKYPIPVSCDPAVVQIQQGSLGLDTWKAPITKF